MATTKILGITGGKLTIGGVDYLVESGSLKLEQEKIEYAPIGGNGWAVQIPGGKKKGSGSIKGAVDTALLGAGTYPAPFSEAEVAFAFTIGAKTISGNCVVSDIDFKSENKGLLEFTANFETSGVVSYA